MKNEIIKYLPYGLSALTIWSMLLAGNKKRGAWLVGLLNQFLWLIWIALSGAWGLLPMNLALWVVYFRNYIKWDIPKPDDPTAFFHYNAVIKRQRAEINRLQNQVIENIELSSKPLFIPNKIDDF